MKAAVLIAILAFAAIAEASRVNVLRSMLSYDDDDKDHRDDKDDKEPKYCKDHEKHGDCPDYHECVPLKEKVCKSVRDCKKNSYGEDDCKYVEVCWDYHCVEVPRYCDPYAKYDECEKEYGYDWECKKLDKPVCTYKDKCVPYKTDKCIEYDYETKCVYVNDGCKAYAQKKECKFRDVCIKYKQEQKCDNERVCKKHKQISTCVDKCGGYDSYGNCNRYAKDCTTKRGDCEEYEYKKVNCKYVDTDKCIQYKKEEHDCKYVNTHCKEYKQKQKCDKVRKGCKKYEYKDRCEKVEDVCWKGKCVKKPPPPPPKYPPRSHSTPSYGSGYGGNDR